jgi:hypothetical protein
MKHLLPGVGMDILVKGKKVNRDFVIHNEYADVLIGNKVWVHQPYTISHIPSGVVILQQEKKHFNFTKSEIRKIAENLNPKKFIQDPMDFQESQEWELEDWQEMVNHVKSVIRSVISNKKPLLRKGFNQY